MPRSEIGTCWLWKEKSNLPRILKQHILCICFNQSNWLLWGLPFTMSWFRGTFPPVTAPAVANLDVWWWWWFDRRDHCDDSFFWKCWFGQIRTKLRSPQKLEVEKGWLVVSILQILFFCERRLSGYNILCIGFTNQIDYFRGCLLEKTSNHKLTIKMSYIWKKYI